MSLVLGLEMRSKTTISSMLKQIKSEVNTNNNRITRSKNNE